MANLNPMCVDITPLRAASIRQFRRVSTRVPPALPVLSFGEVDEPGTGEASGTLCAGLPGYLTIISQTVAGRPPYSYCAYPFALWGRMPPRMAPPAVAP